MLSESILKAHLADYPFRYYDSVGSTNDSAKAWLSEDAPDGAVVVADAQTQGRGRLGRDWQTPPHSALALSLVLRPRHADILPQVTMLGAVMVAIVLEALDVPNVKIKWPNDVLVNGLKVCGILSEAQWQGQNLQGVILGIGVNVRVDFRGTALEHKATSIETALGASVDRADMVSRLVQTYQGYRKDLGKPRLFEAWRSRLVTLGQVVHIQTADGEKVGTAEAVTADGALVLRQADGQAVTLYAGDVGI